MRDYADAIRYWFGAFLLATSIGLNLALIADRSDVQGDTYIDGTEANGLLDAGFRIYDPSGAEVEYFLPDGSHSRYDCTDGVDRNSVNASAAECAA